LYYTTRRKERYVIQSQKDSGKSGRRGEEKEESDLAAAAGRNLTIEAGSRWCSSLDTVTRNPLV
jgi:hypothetical protein